MTKDEALKLALEALKRGESQLRWEAIAAIEEVLAEPEQEPVANLTINNGLVSVAKKILPDGICDLYTTTPAQPELTPKMRKELNLRLSDHWYGCADEVWRIILASDTAQPPPQRTWVGLTDEEITELRLKTFDAIATNHEGYRAIEAKLKEKNK